MRSTTLVSAGLMRGGANSLMYSATPSENGTATRIATSAISTVPTRIAAIPKFPESGSHACVVRNPHPATRSASHARASRNSPTVAMTTSTPTPLAVSTARNTRSLPERRVPIRRGSSCCAGGMAGGGAGGIVGGSPPPSASAEALPKWRVPTSTGTTAIARCAPPTGSARSSWDPAAAGALRRWHRQVKRRRTLRGGQGSSGWPPACDRENRPTTSRSYAVRVTSPTSDVPRARLAILASGTGSTAAAIMDAAGTTIDATVALVISNNSGSGALEHARTRGVPTLHLSGVTHPDPDALDSAMVEALADARIELVVLAGYMKKLGPRTLDAFSGLVVNTHPALLPAYGGQGMYGDRVHAAVLADGAPQTGASVHIVTAEYDAGPVLAQAVVPVEPSDDVASLRTRVQAAEKSLLLDWLATHFR